MRSAGRLAVLLPLFGVACGSAPSLDPRPGTHPRVDRAPPLQLVFRGEQVLAREHGREWPISEVPRAEMLWAPDGERFAYVVERRGPSPGSQPTSQPAARTPAHRIVVRNQRGDSVQEFPVYRPGRPSELDWIDNRTLGYLAPPDPSGAAYVIHSADDGEILRVLRGAGFVWSPGRRQLAYVTNVTRDQSVAVDDATVWPRTAPARSRAKSSRRAVLGDLVWSPDGQGLAFIAQNGRGAHLVVLLVVDDHGGDMEWPIPSEALGPSTRVFWGESQVVVGTSLLKPRFAARWQRVQ